MAGSTSRTVPVHCRAILLLSLAATGLPAGAQPSLVDQLLRRYIRPKAVVGDDTLHLLYQRKMDSQDRVLTCYRRLRPDKGWSEETEFQNDYLSVAHFAGSLILFRKDNYSIYRATDWRPRKWALGWAPVVASTAGQELWVFGADVKEKRHRLVAARLTRAEAEGGLAGPAPLAEPLGVPTRPYDIGAVSRGASAMVLWHQRGSAPSAEGLPTNELWSATFDGKQWGKPRSVPVPCDYSDYAAVAHEGEVWVLCKERGRRLSASNPLQTIRLSDTGWSTPSAVPGTVDSLLDWTFDVDAASFAGRLYVFRACMTRLVVHRWRDGQWEGVTTLSAAPPWATVALWWSLVNLVLGLALLPVVAACAFRSRGREAQLAAFGDGELPVATWPRRVAALLIDLLVTEFICTAAIALLSILYGSESTAESVPLMVGLHLVVFFVYFVVTEGRSGQSLGKRLLSTMVVGQDGQRPSLGAIVVRNLLRPWPFLMPAAYLAGSIFLLLTRRSQRLGDLLARTVVVELPMPVPSKH